MTDDETQAQFANEAHGDAYNPKMLAAKAKLLERFRREGEGYQPSTLKTTPSERIKRRVPQGQHETKGFPILDLGVRPAFNPQLWRFKVWGEVENPLELTFDEWKALPRVRQTSEQARCPMGWRAFF
jgi:DMSO/TMAO reductase YedYZ molybdopterin-dependent catalytic subunit